MRLLLSEATYTIYCLEITKRPADIVQSYQTKIHNHCINADTYRPKKENENEEEEKKITKIRKREIDILTINEH